MSLSTEKLLDNAWGVISNVGGGDWTKESAIWQAAAKKWRDDWHDSLKAKPEGVPFPPHWFTIYRIGTTVHFSLIPATSPVQSYQWRLYLDGIRAGDMLSIIALMEHEPENQVFILVYVDSIDLAHYLMQSARTAWEAFTPDERERLFAKPPVTQPDLGKPAEPAPPGDPATFTMEELQADLDRNRGGGYAETHPVPFGTAHQFPQGAKCGRTISHDNVCGLPQNHTGPCQS